MTNVIIDGIEYAPITKAAGTRSVVVIDRDWIFAGDVTRENGRIKLSNAVHVVRWEQIGFAGMIENPGSSKVTLQKSRDIDIPAISEIYCVPVGDEWGVK